MFVNGAGDTAHALKIATEEFYKAKARLTKAKQQHKVKLHRTELIKKLREQEEIARREHIKKLREQEEIARREHIKKLREQEEILALTEFRQRGMEYNNDVLELAKKILKRGY
jgi:hypothetical protein